jgi:hypothetical protein
MGSASTPEGEMKEGGGGGYGGPKSRVQAAGDVR